VVEKQLSGDLARDLADQIRRVLAGDSGADRDVAERLLPVYEETLRALQEAATDQTGNSLAGTQATIRSTERHLDQIRAVLTRRV
jgi:enterochelin esterase-like enzyme